MKTRQVFSTPDLAAAKAAMSAARMAGVDDEDISLIARADIEMEDIPSNRIDVSNDMVPAALRGAAMGGGLGLVGGRGARGWPAPRRPQGLEPELTGRIGVRAGHQSACPLPSMESRGPAAVEAVD